ncbi:methyltransferase type 11 [Sphaerisporangium krabiense]|uniref:Ubiquinone/menaquinone biosynthesis C-methylase UbiE n=1 Tax=Sphaerisporangium krabiense TaxID=763782 RepID=A0A7W9DQJ9_9ACTN|nr:class I SAM-dependent methyltransferase [Sphaerisporangium krabiense]MBB5627114.1 ubiquinone/menaquinone biosynthesis C-methylase UbiE [Sphaerisporangium krabiense]GII65270.1 methyltransferase type 11 [Sphaerisporangium krabiense]
MKSRTNDAYKNTSQAAHMEGIVARWYTRQRSSADQLAAVRASAAHLAAGLRPKADILEVAPGPGFLAVELARLGHTVSGLDASRSFVEIARRHAREAGVGLDMRHGDAAALPFADASFDLVACQAAFKNFGDPVGALNEMHRVLRPGGTAFVDDMNRDVTAAQVDEEVRGMGLGPLSSLMTKIPLLGLRRRAYSPARFRRLAADTAFRTCEIETHGITLQVRLTKNA